MRAFKKKRIRSIFVNNTVLISKKKTFSKLFTNYFIFERFSGKKISMI